jgi:hypothetical protein
LDATVENFADFDDLFRSAIRHSTHTTMLVQERLEDWEALLGMPDLGELSARLYRGATNPLRSILHQWAAAEFSRGFVGQSPSVRNRTSVHHFNQVRERFNQLVAQWKRNTSHKSIAAQVIADSSYLKIIALGWYGVPLIIEELKQDPDYWFAALEAITEAGTEIVPSDQKNPMSIHELAKRWIEWWKETGEARFAEVLRRGY